MNVKHSFIHRPRIGETVKPHKERKERRTWGPLDNSIVLRDEGTTVHLCGDSNVAETWTNGHLRDGTEVQRTNWRIPENVAFLVEEERCVLRGEN